MTDDPIIIRGHYTPSHDHTTTTVDGAAAFERGRVRMERDDEQHEQDQVALCSECDGYGIAMDGLPCLRCGGNGHEG